MTQSEDEHDKSFFCQYCQSGWDKKTQLASHERQCPMNPANFKEPEIEDAKPDIDKIMEDMGVSPEIIALSKNPTLDAAIQAKYAEFQQLADAKKIQKTAEDAQRRKHSEQLKSRGYQREPEVFGNYKKVILINLEHLAVALDREERAGWECIAPLTAVAPTGAVYMTFKKK